MVVTHLPNTHLIDSEEVLDYYDKACFLIDNGYPVPTKNIDKLARMIEDVEKKKERGRIEGGNGKETKGT